jgi:tetratricopeptide (TPR) repeat protein
VIRTLLCGFLTLATIAGAQPLNRAARNGDVTELRRLLEKDPSSVNEPGTGGFTALHIAVNWERPEAVKELLVHGADPLAKDNDGNTPLSWAIKGKNAEIRRLLEEAARNARPQPAVGVTAAIASTRPATRPSTQPASLWDWLTGKNGQAADGGRQRFTYETHNYTLRELDRPWVRLDPKTLSPDATYAATRADLDMRILVISEIVLPSMTQGAFVDLVSANFESRTPSARRISTAQRSVNGMAGTQTTHDFRVGVTPAVRNSWMYVRNGFAYQLVVVGPSSARGQIEKAVSDLMAGFTMIDPERDALPSRRMDKFVSNLGFTVDLADAGWESASETNLEHLHSAFLARRGNYPRVSVLVATLAGRKAELQEIARVMARMAEVSVLPDTVMQPLRDVAGTEGLSFQVKWTQGESSGRIESRIIRRGDLVYLLSAITDEAHKDLDLARILDSIQLVPNAAPLAPERMSPRQCFTMGVFLNEMGIQSLQRRDPSAAGFFEAARLYVPDDWMVFCNYVDAIEKTAGQRPALLAINRELDRFKRKPEIMVLKASLEADAGETDQAKQTYADLFQSGYQNDAQFRTYLALFTKNQLHDQAIAAAEEYVSRSGSVGATLILSELYADRGNHDRALKLLLDQQDKMPFNSALAMGMGEIYQQTGEFVRTEELVQKLLDAGNDSSQTYILKGRAEFCRKLYRKAKDSFETARRKSPGDPAAHEWIAMVSRVLGEGDNTAISQAIAPVGLPGALLQIPDAARIASMSAGHSACYLVHATAIAFEPGKSMATTEYRTIKILDTHGVEQFNTFQQQFDPLFEHIYVNRLIVRDEQGNSIAEGRPADYYVLDDRDNETTTSRRTLNIPVPGVRPGCVIELVYTKCEDPPPKSFEFSEHLFLVGYPADRFVVALRAPRELVNWRGIRAPQPVEVDGMQVWSIAPTLWRNEPLQAPIEDFVSCVMLADRPAMWESVAADYLRTIDDVLKPDPSAAELTKRITADATDDTAGLSALLRYLQTNCTYKAIAFGRRARIPQHVSDILRNGYGDCKDHSLLLMQMLKAADIEAHLALIRAAGPFLPDLPTLDQFDHMIVYVPSRNAFFDTTDQWTSLVSGVPWDLAGRTALVLDPKQPRLLKVGPPPTDSGRIEVQRTARLDARFDLIVRETDRFTGIYAGQFREMLQATEPREQAHLLERIVNATGLSAHIRQLSVTGMDRPDQPIAIELEYVADRAFRKLNGQLVGAIPCPVERYFYEPPLVDARESPFKLKLPTSLNTTVTFEVPSGYEIVGQPVGASAAEPHTRGQATHTVSGGVLHSSLSLANDSISRPADAYEAFVRCRQNIFNGLEAVVALAPKH